MSVLKLHGWYAPGGRRRFYSNAWAVVVDGRQVGVVVYSVDAPPSRPWIAWKVTSEDAKGRTYETLPKTYRTRTLAAEALT